MTDSVKVTFDLSVRVFNSIQNIAKKNAITPSDVINHHFVPSTLKSEYAKKVKLAQREKVWPAITDFLCFQGQIFVKLRRAADGIGMATTNIHYEKTLNNFLQRRSHRRMVKFRLSDFDVTLTGDPWWVDADDFRSAALGYLTKKRHNLSIISEIYDHVVSAIQFARTSWQPGSISGFEKLTQAEQAAQVKVWLTQEPYKTVNTDNPSHYDNPVAKYSAVPAPHSPDAVLPDYDSEDVFDE